MNGINFIKKAFVIFCVLAVGCGTVSAEAADRKKPLFKDFMGMCVHTVKFKPDLYKPICTKVRDYHSFNWDMGKDTDYVPQFPMARNKVSWEHLYGTWVQKGYEVDASIMFGGTPSDSWKDMKRDAFNYGKAFAAYFGPANKGTVYAAEIGNEPGTYSDKDYRTLFENMAKGMREGDPDLKIATCASDSGESGKYHKSLECVKGLNSLYDIINVHVYAQVKGWPTWERSYPEDPDIEYLKKLGRVIEWKNNNASDKEIWITEFGWDCSTKPAPKEGTFKKWVGNTDEEQALYLVRSWLLFSEMDIDRAYMYWFNDNDTPQVHGSSGLTRKYRPKSSFHAVAHLYSTLGDYRFNRIVRKDSELYIYEFVHGTDTKNFIWTVWKPEKPGKNKMLNIPIKGYKAVKAEQTPMAENEKTDIPLSTKKISALFEAGPRPVFLFLRKGK